MYLLYWEYLAGSIVVQAALEEVGAEYELEKIDMAAAQHKSTTFSAICPASTVPALCLPDGLNVGETSAIIHLLDEAYPGNGLLPAVGDANRPAAHYWLAYLASTGYPAVARAWHPYRFASSEPARAEVREGGWSDLKRLFGVVEANITGAPFMLSSGHSIVDSYIAMLLEWMTDTDALFSEMPKLKRLYDAEWKRPAFAKAMQTHTPPVEAKAS